MEEYADIYLLRNHSTYFGCHQVRKHIYGSHTYCVTIESFPPCFTCSDYRIYSHE